MPLTWRKDPNVASLEVFGNSDFLWERASFKDPELTMWTTIILAVSDHIVNRTHYKMGLNKFDPDDHDLSASWDANVHSFLGILDVNFGRMVST